MMSLVRIALERMGSFLSEMEDRFYFGVCCFWLLVIIAMIVFH
jgi:hypothetical protein